MVCVCPTVEAAEMTKLVVWAIIPAEDAPGQNAMIAEFEKRHPGAKVSMLSMGAGSMNPQKLMTAIVGKKPPDVINQDRFTIGDWASRDTFLPLDDYIARDRDKPYGVREEDYYKPCWAEASYKDPNDANAKPRVYAIPNSTDARFLFYNKKVFRDRRAELLKAGLDPNRPPETWDELREYAKALTSFNPDGSFKSVGFIPNYGNSWLYLYSWQNGGEFMDPSGKICTMNNPESVKSLEYMVSVYDALKGAERLDTFQSTFQAAEFDPFLSGKVAMKIDVDGAAGRGIARYAPNLDFGVAPAPVPIERYEQTHPNFVFSRDGAPRLVDPAEWANMTAPKQGRFNGQPRYITWSGGFSYAIPRGAKNADLAWEFIKWMNSPEAGLIGAAAQKAYNQSKGSLYVPTMHANVKVNEAVFDDYAPERKSLRDCLRFALDLMPYSNFRPVTFVGQRLWDEHVRAFDLAIHHAPAKGEGTFKRVLRFLRIDRSARAASGVSPQAAMDNGTYVVQKELNKVFARDKSREVPLWLLLSATGALMLGFIAVVGFKIRQAGRVGKLMRGEALSGYLFAAPWIIGFLVFTIGPIAASIVFSFCDYDVLNDARWVGLHNYSELLTDDWPHLSKCLVNAGFLAVFGIPLGIMTGLAIAMLLNAKVKGMTWYRTIYYLPSIVPVVASAILWIWVLNPEFGIVNAAWRSTLTGWFGINAPGWLAAPEWAKPALILMGLWGAGGGMILWLAGLQGIPQSLYEAADIDGANIWQKFRAVTLPMLTPYIFFTMIMGTIGALQTFDTVYIMTNGGPVDSTVVPVLYLFRNAFQYFKMGYASALAWILFALVLALTAIQLKLAPRWVHYEGEKK